MGTIKTNYLKFKLKLRLRNIKFNTIFIKKDFLK